MSLAKFIFKRFRILKIFDLKLIKCQKRSFMSSPILCEKYESMQDIKIQLNNLLQVKTYSRQSKSKDHLFQYMVKSQDELPIRKMKDSFCTAIIPISKDEELKEKYLTNTGSVRLGRLMEDVDLFAGFVGYKHIKNPKFTQTAGTPYTVVTAYIDTIDIVIPPKPDLDVKISGKVSWVGKSSMEVIVWLHQEIGDDWVQIMKAVMLMAVRNPDNNGPAIINRVEAETDKEKEFLVRGNERKNKRLLRRERSLLITTPTEQEFKIIHNLFMDTMESSAIFSKQKASLKDGQWMTESMLHTLVFCHPEHRNAHNKVFGGFIIRQALELSWTTAVFYTSKIPVLTKISDISFLRPVEVGSVLKLIGTVVFTHDEYLLVFVRAEALDITDLRGISTNGFHFTYKLGTPVPRVYPSSYLEAMKYIDGRRHFLEENLS